MGEWWRGGEIKTVWAVTWAPTRCHARAPKYFVQKWRGMGPSGRLGVKLFRTNFFRSKNWKFCPGRRENGMGQEIYKEIRGGSVATLSPQQAIVPLSHSPLSSKKSNFFKSKSRYGLFCPLTTYISKNFDSKTIFPAQKRVESLAFLVTWSMGRSLVRAHAIATSPKPISPASKLAKFYQ